MQSEKLGNSKAQISLTQKKLSFLTALCLFFSAIEFAIPKPLPFLRLGLANLPIIISFFILPPAQSIALMALKVFVQNLLSGTLFSYTILFSISGTFASGLGMLVLYKLFYENRDNNKQKISIIGINLAGSFFNCLAQLLVSWLFLFGTNTIYIAPLLIGLSFITGLFLGIFAQYFVTHSKWLKQVQEEI